MNRRGGAVGLSPALLLGTTMFFWGTAFRATAIGAGHASAVVFSTMRALVAGLALLAIGRLTGARLPRDRPTLVLAGLS